MNEATTVLTGQTPAITKETPAPKHTGKEEKQDGPDFGDKRYSAEMKRLYGDFQKLFGLPPWQAEKIARQVGSDFGEMMKNQSVAISVSAATGKNHDGKITIGEKVKNLKGVTLTNTLLLVRAVQWIGEAGKNGLSYGFTKWELVPTLKEWLAEMKEPQAK